MNTYAKYVPNVWLAKCENSHEKGETIKVTTQYGKENDCIVFNLIAQKNDCFYYSIVRADGFNHQQWAKKRSEKLAIAALNAQKKGESWQNKSNEGADFLSLGEPIKVGHHSEKKHRALIERNRNRMNNAMKEYEKSEEYRSKIAYWENKSTIINLSMPESLEYYEYKLTAAKLNHDLIKNNHIERQHAYSLTYAKKEVNEIEKKFKLAQQLWG